MSHPENYKQALGDYLKLVATTPPAVLAELTKIFDRRGHAQACGRSAAAELHHITSDSVTAHTRRRRAEYRQSVRDHRLAQEEATILTANWEQGFATQWEKIP